MKVGDRVRFNMGLDTVIYGEVRQLDAVDNNAPDAAMVVEDFATHNIWGRSEGGQGTVHSVRTADLFPVPA